MSRSAGHEQLRTATREHHARLDALFSGFDLSQAGDYRRFLRAHAAAALAVEAALEQAGFADQLSDWAERRRGAAIRSDLAALESGTVDILPTPPLADAAAAWGAAYVLEGSRLGGAVLARQLGAGLPRDYLAGRRTDWPAFLRQLDAALDSPKALNSATRAAIDTFGLFETAGHRELETERSDRVL